MSCENFRNLILKNNRFDATRRAADLSIAKCEEFMQDYFSSPTHRIDFKEFWLIMTSRYYNPKLQLETAYTRGMTDQSATTACTRGSTLLPEPSKRTTEIDQVGR